MSIINWQVLSSQVYVKSSQVKQEFCGEQARHLAASTCPDTWQPTPVQTPGSLHLSRHLAASSCPDTCQPPPVQTPGSLHDLDLDLISLLINNTVSIHK